LHDGKLDRTRARAGVEVEQAQFLDRLVARIANPGPKPRVTVPVNVTERPDRTFENLAERYPTVIRTALHSAASVGGVAQRGCPASP
jgi:hypothetical protein